MEIDTVNLGIWLKNAGYFDGSLFKKLKWVLYALFAFLTSIFFIIALIKEGFQNTADVTNAFVLINTNKTEEFKKLSY